MLSILFASLALIIVSTTFFILDDGKHGMRTRVLVSLHGVLAVALCWGALLAWDVFHKYRPWAAWPYAQLFLLPVSSVIYSFKRFSGDRLLHLLHVVNLFCIPYMLLIGEMAITGNWLL